MKSSVRTQAQALGFDDCRITTAARLGRAVKFFGSGIRQAAIYGALGQVVAHTVRL